MRVVELDFMRFIAALAVVFYHYTSECLCVNSTCSPIIFSLDSVTKFGYLGVPLFFMISGFVIFASATNRTYIEFAVSRFARLYPAYWVCVTLTAATLLLTDNRFHSISIGTYLCNLTMVQGFMGVPNVDGVYWTLLKELQFYLCIFILITFGFLKHTTKWLSLWTFFSITYMLCRQPFFMGWFISPDYSPFFIAGITFYLIKQNGYKPFYKLLILISAVLAIISAYKNTPNFVTNAVVADRVISIGFVLLFFSIFHIISTGRIALEQKPFYVLAGSLTYPLYLLHNIVGRVILDKMIPIWGDLFSLGMAIIIALYSSFLIHVYVEKKYGKLLAFFMKRKLLTSKQGYPAT